MSKAKKYRVYESIGESNNALMTPAALIAGFAFGGLSAVSEDSASSRSNPQALLISFSIFCSLFNLITIVIGTFTLLMLQDAGVHPDDQEAVNDLDEKSTGIIASLKMTYKVH